MSERRQGDVRRGVGDDLRRSGRPSSTSGSTATTTSPSCRSRRQRPDRHRQATPTSCRSTARSRVDLYGQVVADSIDGRQISGVGGHEDFVAGAELHLDAHSLVCLHSTAVRDGEIVSRIAGLLREGSVVSTPRHHTGVVITEYGAAELTGTAPCASALTSSSTSRIPTSGRTCARWPTRSAQADDPLTAQPPQRPTRFNACPLATVCWAIGGRWHRAARSPR